MFVGMLVRFCKSKYMCFNKLTDNYTIINVKSFFRNNYMFSLYERQNSLVKWNLICL